MCGFLVWTSLIGCLLYRWRPGWLQCLVVASICYIPAVTADAQEIFWVGLVSVVAATCAMNLMLGKPTNEAQEVPTDRVRPISIRNLLVLTGLIAGWVTVGTGTPTSLLAVLPLCIVAAIVSIPLPTPQQPTGKNAMPDMLKLAKQFGQSNFAIALNGYQSAAEMPADERGALLAEVEPDIELFLKLSEKPMWTDLKYGRPYKPVNFRSIGNIRAVARALMATAEERLYYDALEDSTKCYKATLRIGSGIRRNGLINHAISEGAIQSLITLSIYEQRKYFDSRTTRELIDALAAKEQEPMSGVGEREREWMIRVN